MYWKLDLSVVWLMFEFYEKHRSLDPRIASLKATFIQESFKELLIL